MSARRVKKACSGVCAGVLVALVPVAPAAAQAPPPDGTVYLHSAARGELDGGRLTLRGVSKRLTWAHHSGRSGVMAVRKMHRRVFAGDAPVATGTLHVAGHHGGDEPAFTLSRPALRPRPAHGQLPREADQRRTGAARRGGPRRTEGDHVRRRVADHPGRAAAGADRPADHLPLPGRREHHLLGHPLGVRPAGRARDARASRRRSRATPARGSRSTPARTPSGTSARSSTSSAATRTT